MLLRRLRAIAEDAKTDDSTGCGQDTEGYVYVMNMGEEGVYKVGHTCNLKRRLREARTFCRSPVYMYSIRVPNAAQLEFQAHAALRSYRDRREFFCAPLLVIIAEIENALRISSMTAVSREVTALADVLFELDRRVEEWL